MHVGTATDRGDNLFGGYLLRAHLDRTPVEQHGAGLIDLCAGVLEPLAVEAFQAGDFLFLVGNEGRPVERRLPPAPAIARRISKMLGELGGIDIELLRHAATDDAGTAKPIFLSNCDPLAEGGCDACRAHTARATADNKKIEVEFRHVLPRLQSLSVLDRQGFAWPSPGSYRAAALFMNSCTKQIKSPDDAGLPNARNCDPQDYCAGAAAGASPPPCCWARFSPIASTTCVERSRMMPLRQISAAPSISRETSGPLAMSCLPASEE